MNRFPISLARLGALLLTAAALIACARTASSPTGPQARLTQIPSTNTQSSNPGPSVGTTETAPIQSSPSTARHTPLPSSSPTITPTPTISSTPTISPTPSITPTPTKDVRPDPELWTSWPTIPTVSAVDYDIYRHGQDLGNDPHSFIRIGDCQSVPDVFMGIYDTNRYWLGDNWKYLQRTVTQFAGAWGRANVTAKDGFSVLSMFSALYSDPKMCNTNETPLECEFRLNKPSFAFISLGTNWQPGASARFEEYLRKIVDFTIAHGAVPILMTKADNVEGDEELNLAIARVAHDYDVPMLNAWLAVYYLPNHGLNDTNVYLTTDAWDERAFSGLVTLDRLWAQLSGIETPTPTP